MRPLPKKRGYYVFMDFSGIFSPIIAIGGGVLFILVLWLIRLEFKWRALFRGKKARTLEDVFLETRKGLEELAREAAILKEKMSMIDERVKRAVCGVGTVRFNPFKGTSGSNQSFATAFLDEEGNGVVLSSMYSREHVSVFAKPVKNRASEYGLTEEEKAAIGEASKR